jgi:hypothetical protein
LSEQNPDRTSWQPISAEERAVIGAILSTPGVQCPDAVLAELDNALVAHGTTWILDVRMPAAVAVLDYPDGPLPVCAFVTKDGGYQGEIIVWITDGQISGLEFASVTDDPPRRWPRPAEMELQA